MKPSPPVFFMLDRLQALAVDLTDIMSASLLSINSAGSVATPSVTIPLRMFSMSSFFHILLSFLYYYGVGHFTLGCSFGITKPG